MTSPTPREEQRERPSTDTKCACGHREDFHEDFSGMFLEGCRFPGCRCSEWKRARTPAETVALLKRGPTKMEKLAREAAEPTFTLAEVETEFLRAFADHGDAYDGWRASDEWPRLRAALLKAGGEG